MDTELTKKTLEKIEEEKLRPKSVWFFRLEKISLWVLITGGGVIAAFGIGILFNFLSEQPIIPFFFDGAWRPSILFQIISWFWPVVIVLFVGTIVTAFKNTKNGYKYSVPLIVVIFLMALVIGGGLAFFSGAARKADKTLEFVPMYREMAEHRGQVWVRPQEGFLEGMVVDVKDETSFHCMDLGGVVWQVEVLKIMDEAKLVRENDRVVLFGSALENEVFQAFRIHIKGTGRR
ncbi:hypothetical protein KJ766_00670 [Patescibacteria group bacterium]|nr:hypothetical protein [Patescibacteria group bacterium]